VGGKNCTSHFSYKGTLNAVLMVIVNVNYEFLLTDVGKLAEIQVAVFSKTKSNQLFTKKKLTPSKPENLSTSKRTHHSSFLLMKHLNHKKIRNLNCSTISMQTNAF
jgi:hypothetical protein